MMPWDDLQSFMGKMAQDSSSNAMTFLKMMYNAGYKIVLTEFGRQVTEQEATLDLQNNVRGYQVAADCMWPKTLELLDGTTIDPLTEITSDKQWAMMKSGTSTGKPTHYHYKPRFGVGGGVLELWPVPSGDNYDLRMTYETRDKDLSEDAYNAGTIALTTDSALVTGTSVTFTTAMIGRYLMPTKSGSDKLPYRIAGRTSNTVINLENNYAGATDTGMTYRIVEIPNLPEDMHLIPAYFALEQWWSSKGDSKKQQEFMSKWTIGMARAKKTHSVTTRDNEIPADMGAVNLPGLPSYFPTMITG